MALPPCVSVIHWPAYFAERAAVLVLRVADCGVLVVDLLAVGDPLDPVGPRLLGDGFERGRLHRVDDHAADLLLGPRLDRVDLLVEVGARIVDHDLVAHLGALLLGGLDLGHDGADDRRVGEADADDLVVGPRRAEAAARQPRPAPAS